MLGTEVRKARIDRSMLGWGLDELEIAAIATMESDPDSDDEDEDEVETMTPTLL